MPSETPEGKGPSSQNARKHSFNPDPFAIVRIEDRAGTANRIAGGVPPTCQSINSQERSAVECIALAKHSMLRMYTLEAGFFTTWLDQAMEASKPFILERPEISNGIGTALHQHRSYWIAFGFNRFTRRSNIAAAFLRFPARAERLHRRAVEDLHRLLKLRGQLPAEEYLKANEPNIEPILALQPTENTAAPPCSHPVPNSENEPNAEPSPRLAALKTTLGPCSLPRQASEAHRLNLPPRPVA
jgi:hypothetical protein